MNNNGVRSLTQRAPRAYGRYLHVRVDSDLKYQSGSTGLIIGVSSIERPPLLTGVIVSTGERVPSAYQPGMRIPFARGDGYASWFEPPAKMGDEPTEYRVLGDEQLEGIELEHEAKDDKHPPVLRMRFTGQIGVMD